MGTATRQILLVEDDRDIREALVDVLSDENFTVTAAGHGQEALDFLQDGYLPEVIVLDLMMPVMNGWQFCEKIETHPVWGKIPILILSADANVHDRVAGLKVAGVLRKPIRLDQLLTAIEPHLAG